MWSKAAIATVGLAASLGIGGAAYAATSSSPTHASAATATSARSTGKAKGLLARADHGTLEIKRKGQWVTYELDRGKVTAVSPTSITLARPDGQTVTEAIDSATKFKGVSSEAGIQTGRSALVLSENGTAVRVRQGSGTGSAGAGTAAATLGGSVD